MVKLKGVCPPVITIFGDDGRIDFEANKEQADFLIAKGVDGLAYLGTSGEFPVLGLDEKKALIEEMTAYVAGRVKVIVGVGGTNFQEVEELLTTSEEAGVDGVLIINPYFCVYSEAMVEAYYDAAAAFTQLPIILYNYPDLTGFDLNYNLVERLIRKHENIVGIKETVANFSHLREMCALKAIRPEFTVFCAFEDQMMNALLCGAEGMINATANFAPEFTVGLYQSFAKNQLAEAAMYYGKVCGAMEIYNFSQPLFLACKEAVYQRVLGRDGSERLPALALSSAVKNQIGEKLNQMFVQAGEPALQLKEA